MALSQKRQLGVHIRMAFFKKIQSPKLTDEKGILKTDYKEQLQDVGTHVSSLIPCLDPDLDESAYLIDDLMGQRTFE